MRGCILVCALWLGACKGGAQPLDSDTGLPVGGELLGVGVAPRDPVASVGESIPFFATAYYENTTYEDITGEVGWATTDGRVATIGADGVAVAVGEGETEVVATAPGGATNRVKLTVLAGGVVTTGLTVQPSAVSVNVGQTVQLSPLASYSDGSTGTFGAACAWTTTDGGIASVSGSGLVGAVSAGSATIGATCGSFAASANVTVAAADVDLGEPDLVVSYFDAIAIGGDVLWFVDVRNDGDGYAGGFFVDVFLDAPGPPSSSAGYDDTAYVSGLAPGATSTLYLELEAAPAGSFSSWAGADLDDWVAESDEGNNVDGPVALDTAPAALGPDLVVVDAYALTDGLDTLYRVEVRNDGDETAYDFWIDLWTDEATSPAACAYGDAYERVDALAPGATHTWEPLVEDAPGFLGTWRSWVWADGCDEIGDAFPSDNLYSFTVEDTGF